MSGKRLTLAHRRAMIVSAGLRVFADAGTDRASMRAVAKTAGITTPVFYDHFASKADLYATLVETTADDLISRWEHEVAGTPEDLFRATIGTIFDWISANEAGWRMTFLDSPSDPAVAAAHRRRQDRATQVLTTQFARVPELALSVALPRERADAFLAEAAKWTVNAIAAWWWANRDLTRDQIVELTTDLLWRWLKHITKEQGNHSVHSGPSDGGRDIELALGTLADDVVLRSPPTDRFTFTGKEEVRKLFETAYEHFEELHYHTEIGDGAHRVLVGGATADGQPFEETLVLTLNEDNKIAVITLFIRPLPGITAVMALLGPHLARKTGRSRFTAGVLRVLAAPLVAATRAGDRFGLRLALPKRGVSA